MFFKITVNGTASIDEEDEPEFTVSGVSFASGTGTGGAALAELVRGALAARGVRARVAVAPAACGAPATPDARACLEATLAALARGALHVALVPTERAPAPPRLRDAGLEELGDAAPPAHRACFALPARAPAAEPPPPPRSLLDFADADLAAHYALSRADLEFAVRSLSLDGDYK